MGAYDAAARDARRALEYEGVSSSSRSRAAATAAAARAKKTPTPYHPAPSSSSDVATTTTTATATLRAGALCALGYSLLRRGRDPDGSAASFEEAASLARWGLDETAGDPASTSALRDVLARATSGSSSLRQCRALRSRLRSDEHDVEALDDALLISPGDVDMHLSRVEALVRRRRWSDVANRIEMLAARAAGWEGTFRDCGGQGVAAGGGGGGGGGDDDDRLCEVDPLLASTYPPLGVAYVDFLRGRGGMPALEELRPDFFDDRPEDHVGDGVDDDDDDDRRRAAVLPPHLRTLGPKAARDAVFRIPGVLLPHYLRALRLEERYAAATMAGSALSDFIDRANVVVEDPPPRQTTFCVANSTSSIARSGSRRVRTPSSGTGPTIARCRCTGSASRSTAGGAVVARPGRYSGSRRCGPRRPSPRIPRGGGCTRCCTSIEPLASRRWGGTRTPSRSRRTLSRYTRRT